jgi:Tfp pilus assembly protein PilP
MSMAKILIWSAVMALVLTPVTQGWAQDELVEEANKLAEEEEVDVSRIDDILRGDQRVQHDDFFSYDPAGRRDPFRSLLDGLDAPDEEEGRVRPPGLPGMMIEELRLEGIIETSAGILAFVVGRDNLSYILRPETKLYNGEVKEILSDRVIFRQQADDPKQTQPYEEVVRVLADD